MFPNRSLEIFKKMWRGFPGGSVVKNPPANAGDTSLLPDLGRSHMLQSNSACATAIEPML